MASSSSAFLEGPRHAVVTPDDNGAVLQVVMWYLMVLMILATMLRIALRVNITQAFGFDDALAVVALLCGVREVAAMSLGVSDGLGTRTRLLTKAQSTNIAKRILTAQVLYLSTLAISKGSALSFLSRLVVQSVHKRILLVLGVVLALWASVSILTTTFVCGLPHFDDIEQRGCLAMMPLWYAISTIDIVTDLALILLPTALVWDLRMHLNEKIIVIVAFALRLMAVATQIARLALLRGLQDSFDPNYDSLANNLATQVQMAASLITASIPAYRPFMKRAATGMMAVSLAQGGSVTDHSASYALQPLSSHGKLRSRKDDSDRVAWSGGIIRKTVQVEVGWPEDTTGDDEARLNPGRASAEEQITWRT